MRRHHFSAYSTCNQAKGQHRLGKGHRLGSSVLCSLVLLCNLMLCSLLCPLLLCLPRARVLPRSLPVSSVHRTRAAACRHHQRLTCRRCPIHLTTPTDQGTVPSIATLRPVTTPPTANALAVGLRKAVRHHRQSLRRGHRTRHRLPRCHQNLRHRRHPRHLAHLYHHTQYHLPRCATSSCRSCSSRRPRLRPQRLLQRLQSTHRRRRPLRQRRRRRCSGPCSHRGQSFWCYLPLATPCCSLYTGGEQAVSPAIGGRSKRRASVEVRMPLA